MSNLRSRSWTTGLSLVAVSCILGLAAVVGCGSQEAPEVVAVLVPPITGTVLVQDRPAVVGAELRAGDTLIARGDAAAAAIKFPDGTIVHLFGLGAPGGEAKLVISSYAPGTGAMLLRLAGGLLTLVSPAKDAPPARSIEALNTVTATEGTEVKVRSGPDEDVISLKSGRVRVTPTAGGAVITLAPGQEVRVKHGQAPSAPAPYDAASEAERRLYLGPDPEPEKHL